MAVTKQFHFWFTFTVLLVYTRQVNGNQNCLATNILQKYLILRLKSFQILKDEFSLPGFSFFLYLRLRSALKAYGVPWSIKISPHPMVNWIDSSMASIGIVNIIYKSLVVRQYSNIPTEGFWERELNIVIDWDNVWGNGFVTSKNPAHQMIHYKLIYNMPLLVYYIKWKESLTSSVTCVIALVKVHIYICSGTVPELPCSGPWYSTYCRIFWRLRSKRTHCFFFCWMIRRCRCLSIKKWFCLLLSLLPKRLF